MSLKYKCKFQDNWCVKEQYREWIIKDTRDAYSARCKWCLKTFNVGAMGESALKSHMISKKHKEYDVARRQGQGKLNLAAFLNKGVSIFILII